MREDGDRQRACRIAARARDKQNSRMPRWQARASGRPIASSLTGSARFKSRAQLRRILEARSGHGTIHDLVRVGRGQHGASEGKGGQAFGVP
jgi:hypothetical protein